MASSSAVASAAAALLLLLSLLSVASAGRPCRAFIISTVSSANFELVQIRSVSTPTDAVAALRFFASQGFIRRHPLPEPVVAPVRLISFPRPLPAADRPGLPLVSLQARARDILVVVVGLLFGVGCGALTAATMYLAWSLVASRYEICGSDRYDDDENEVESPKKIGYVTIPAAADPVPAHKEGYEGN